MKTVIAVRGTGNCGKTISIVSAKEMLLRSFRNAEIEIIHPGRKEVCLIITIDGVKIGIESVGDPSSRLPKSLEFFVKKGCKIIVCATRSYGRNTEAVERLNSQHNYQIIWLKKTHSSSAAAQETDNLAMAKKIVQEVKKAIGQ